MVVSLLIALNMFTKRKTSAARPGSRFLDLRRSESLLYRVRLVAITESRYILAPIQRPLLLADMPFSGDMRSNRLFVWLRLLVHTLGLALCFQPLQIAAGQNSDKKIFSPYLYIGEMTSLLLDSSSGLDLRSPTLNLTPVRSTHVRDLNEPEAWDSMMMLSFVIGNDFELTRQHYLKKKFFFWDSRENSRWNCSPHLDGQVIIDTTIKYSESILGKLFLWLTSFKLKVTLEINYRLMSILFIHRNS